MLCTSGWTGMMLSPQLRAIGWPLISARGVTHEPSGMDFAWMASPVQYCCCSCVMTPDRTSEPSPARAGDGSTGTDYGAHGAETAHVVSAANEVAESNAFDPPLLAMYSVLLKCRMNLVGKFSDRNCVPPETDTGQNVASCRLTVLPFIGCRSNWKLKCRRKSPG